MKKNNISGNEFVQTLIGVRRAKFFGDKMETACRREKRKVLEKNNK